MATYEHGNRWQTRITHKLLPGGKLFRVFDTEEQGRTFEAELKSLLDRGFVPQDILEEAQARAAAKLLPNSGLKLADVITAYEKGNASISRADRDMCSPIRGYVGDALYANVDFAYAQDLTRGMRVDANMAPGTIRARIGCIARAIAWYNATHKIADMQNPFRMLPKGYSIASPEEVAIIKARGGEEKRSEARDRRLEGDEERRLMAVLSGENINGVRQPHKKDAQLLMLVRLILNTGLRLREAYRLEIEDVELWSDRGQIVVHTSKQHRGGKKLRHVPLVPTLREELRNYIERTLPEDAVLLFPAHFNGDWNEENMRATTQSITRILNTVCSQAGIENLREHDLRHEAACRWFTLKRANGAFVFNENQILKIMGWTSGRLVPTYLSLRGQLMDDLADVEF